MAKVVLLSILVGTLAIPVAYSRRPGSAKRGLRRMLGAFVAFSVLWVLSVLYLYPRL